MSEDDIKIARLEERVLFLGKELDEEKNQGKENFRKAIDLIVEKTDKLSKKVERLNEAKWRMVVYIAASGTLGGGLSKLLF